MGSGSWTSSDFSSYSSSQGRSVSEDGYVKITKETSFKEEHVHKTLDSTRIGIRECRNTPEHPNTIPIILGLDVTGSMSDACNKTLSSLGVIIANLYAKYKDIEICMMGIGDVNCGDTNPIQMGQFESDIRIAKDLDRLYLEKGGGGNGYETYTTAWYMGLYHADLDCWKQGRKGIIITMGDEPCNPYIDGHRLRRHLLPLENNEEDVDTDRLYKEVIKKYDIYHISVDDEENCYRSYKDNADNSWKFLGNHYMISTIENLPKAIISCIDNSLNFQSIETEDGSTLKEISW